MVQRNVPDGEGLKFCVPGLNAPPILMVQLGQAGGHLAAARTGGGDDYQGAPGLNIIIFAVAGVADDLADAGRVAVDQIVVVHRHACRLQPGLKGVQLGGGGVLGEYR